MSTKIYRGFRIRNGSYNSVYDTIQRFRLRALQYASIDYSEVIANSIVDIVDRAQIGDAEAIEHCGKSMESVIRYVTYKNALRVSEQRKSMERDPIYDYDCDINISPLDDDWIIGFVNCEKDDYYKILLMQDGVEEYSYWDNVDPPQDCDSREWKQRKKDWTGKIGANGNISHQSFIHKLFSGYDIPTITANRVNAALPTFQERVRSMAKWKAFHEYKDYIQENDLRFQEDSIERHVDEYLAGLEEYKKTLLYQYRYQEIVEEMEGALTPTINIPDFAKWHIFAGHPIPGDDDDIVNIHDFAEAISCDRNEIFKNTLAARKNQEIISMM